VTAIPLSLLPDTAEVLADGSLAIGGCRVLDVVAEYGTPVFVYDEEHLRARRPDLGTVTLERDSTTRTVRCRQPATSWEELLDEANNVRDTAQQDGWLNDASTESIVTGLCRAALDGALRQAAINRAVRRGIAVEFRSGGAGLGAWIGGREDPRREPDHRTRPRVTGD